MFLHIGGDVVVPLKEIIAIVKPEHTRGLQVNKLVEAAEKAGFVVQLGEKPLSCIITEKQVYISPISAETLHKRVQRGPWAGN